MNIDLTNRQNDTFLAIKHAFFNHFGNLGYKTIRPVKIDRSDSKHAFVRSINTKPAYEYINNNRFIFGSPKVIVSQTVVRPEDFLPLEMNRNEAGSLELAKGKFRCGIFEMLAIWQAGRHDIENIHEESLKESKYAPLYSLFLEILVFFRDVLGLDPRRMWFSLWPGGSVAQQRGYIPSQEEAKEFLRKIWGAKPEQIAWDEENIWPDLSNQRFLDPERTGLIAPRIEMYYCNSKTFDFQRYPKTLIECHDMTFFELISAIPILWIDDKRTKSLRELPSDKIVSEVAFGIERAAVCVEGAASVHEIAFFDRLKEAINKVSKRYTKREIFDDSVAHKTLFSKVIDRLRFLVFATAQGIGFAKNGRGATLRKSAVELFQILKAMDLDNWTIVKICEEAWHQLAVYYPELKEIFGGPLGDLMHQHLNPAYVLGFDYKVSNDGKIVKRSIVKRPNTGVLRRQRTIPELHFKKETIC